MYSFDLTDLSPGHTLTVGFSARSRLVLAFTVSLFVPMFDPSVHFGAFSSSEFCIYPCTFEPCQKKCSNYGNFRVQCLTKGGVRWLVRAACAGYNVDLSQL